MRRGQGWILILWDVVGSSLKIVARGFWEEAAKNLWWLWNIGKCNECDSFFSILIWTRFATFFYILNPTGIDTASFNPTFDLRVKDWSFEPDIRIKRRGNANNNFNHRIVHTSLKMHHWSNSCVWQVLMVSAHFRPDKSDVRLSVELLWTRLAKARNRI